MRNTQGDPPKGNVIFRRFRRLKNGKILDAWDYGHKAWPILIK